MTTPLTDEDKMNVRRHLGYAPKGSDTTGYPSGEHLEWRLTHLLDVEVEMVQESLKDIKDGYQDWQDARKRLRSKSIAIIERNENEMFRRREYYLMACVDLARWLQVPYWGPSPSGDTTNVVV